MIDKISGNEVYYGNSKQRNHHALQAYENTPGAKTAEKKTVKSPGASYEKTVSPKAEKSSGVILDLSAKDLEPPKEREGAVWLEKIRSFFAPVIQWFKNFWESGSVETKEKTEADELAIQEPPDELPPLDEIEVEEEAEEAVKEPVDYGPILEKAVRSGSLKQIERALTQDGAKRLAHNSDLLTYYDRRGNLVEIDDTEKHRVLFGDKNIFKL